MKTFKIVATISLTLLTSICFAQYGYGGYGGMRGGMNRQAMPMSQPTPQKRELNINFTGAAGYFEIDSEECIKKIKIKKDMAKQEFIIKTLESYDTARQALVDPYRNEFDILEFAKENIELAQNDMNELRKIMASVRESINTVKPELIKIHDKLNKDMLSQLSKKEAKRWTKFYNSECKSNKFDPTAPLHPAPEEGDRPQRGQGERARRK